MIAQLVMALGAVLLLWAGGTWLRRAYPQRVQGWLTALGLSALVMAGLWLLATGKIAGLVAILAGLAPWLGRALRLHGLLRLLRGLGKAPPGGRGGEAGEGEQARAGGEGLSEAEARAILGVEANADTAAIKAAYRRLMEANHPDHGGSTWIAARLNQARDRLLR